MNVHGEHSSVRGRRRLTPESLKRPNPRRGSVSLDPQNGASRERLRRRKGMDMRSTGSVGALGPRSLVQDGAGLCEELVRRSRRVLTIPFVGHRLVVAVESLSPVRPARVMSLSPEFSDLELARIAARAGAPVEPAWERSLSLQYGGIRRF